MHRCAWIILWSVYFERGIADVLLNFFCRLQVDVRNQPCFRKTGPILGLAHIKFWQKRNRLRKKSDLLNASTFSGEEFPDCLFFRGVIFGRFSPYFILPSPSGRTEPALFSTIGPILGLAHMKFWQKRNRLRKNSDQLNASTFSGEEFLDCLFF